MQYRAHRKTALDHTVWKSVIRNQTNRAAFYLMSVILSLGASTAEIFTYGVNDGHTFLMTVGQSFSWCASK